MYIDNFICNPRNEKMFLSGISKRVDKIVSRLEYMDFEEDAVNEFETEMQKIIDCLVFYRKILSIETVRARDKYIEMIDYSEKVKSQYSQAKKVFFDEFDKEKIVDTKKNLVNISLKIARNQKELIGNIIQRRKILEYFITTCKSILNMYSEKVKYG